MGPSAFRHRGLALAPALVPPKLMVEKFAHTRFEPSGWTGNGHIGFAKSIMDYIFRWLQLRLLSGHQLSLFPGLAGGTQRTAAPGLAEEPLRGASGSNSLDTRPGRQPVASYRNQALLVRPAPAGTQQRPPLAELHHGRPGNLTARPKPVGVARRSSTRRMP